MKKASVVCAMDPFEIGLASPLKAEGYECEIAGIPMVVHRMLRCDKPPHSKLGAVTEPTTGRAIFTGVGRADAIRGAEETVELHGGPDAVRREIEKHDAVPTEPKHLDQAAA